MRRFILLALASSLAAAGIASGGIAFQAPASAAAVPTEAGCREQSPPQLVNGRVMASPLPGMIEGHAAGTTGGLGQRLLIVRATEDHRPSPRAPALPGTLRWAIETAAAEGGGWILFDPSLAGGEIRLTAPLRPGPDTTIDGACSAIRLTADARVTLLVIASRNVIVSGLSLSKDAYQDAEDRTGDAISIGGDADRVAILHNAFRRCGDGCVDIVRRERSDRETRVTVAFNRFSDHNKVMLIGTLTCSTNPSAVGCDDPLAHLGDALRSRIFVTIQGNVFERTSQRHPKVVSNAAVELVNNVIMMAATPYPDGRHSAVYGATASSGGLLLAVGNLVGRIDAPVLSLALGPIDAINANRRSAEPPGIVSGRGNVTIGPVRLALSGPGQTMPSASARLRVVEVTERNATEFAACLGRIAGPAGIGFRWPEICNSQ